MTACLRRDAVLSLSRMAENDAYLRECDENEDTKNYIVSLLKDYYEGRLRGIALRYQ